MRCMLRLVWDHVMSNSSDNSSHVAPHNLPTAQRNVGTYVGILNAELFFNA